MPSPGEKSTQCLSASTISICASVLIAALYFYSPENPNTAINAQIGNFASNLSRDQFVNSQDENSDKSTNENEDIKQSITELFEMSDDNVEDSKSENSDYQQISIDVDINGNIVNDLKTTAESVTTEAEVEENLTEDEELADLEDVELDTTQEVFTPYADDDEVIETGNFETTQSTNFEEEKKEEEYHDLDNSQNPWDLPPSESPLEPDPVDQKRLNQIERVCKIMRYSNNNGVKYFMEESKGLINKDSVHEHLNKWHFGEHYFVPTKLQKEFLKNLLGENISVTKENIDKIQPGLFNTLMKDFKKYYIQQENLFCIPPKTGTTNWRRLLTLVHYQNKASIKAFYENLKEKEANVTKPILTHPEKIVMYDQEVYDAPRQNYYYNILPRLMHKEYLPKRKEILEDNFRYKTLHVRHPVERLYSAWKQKFAYKLNGKDNWKLNVYYPYLKYMNNPQPTDTHIVGFDTFVDYFLTTRELNPNPLDPNHKPKRKIPIEYHWHSMIRDCMPCEIKYHFVSKLETAHEDGKRIFKFLFNRTDIGLPKPYPNHVSGTEKANKWLNETQINALRERFKWELEMFDYEY